MTKAILYHIIFNLLLIQTKALKPKPPTPAPPPGGYKCTSCVNNVCVGLCNATSKETITPCYGDDICHVNLNF